MRSHAGLAGDPISAGRKFHTYTDQSKASKISYVYLSVESRVALRATKIHSNLGSLGVGT